MDYTTSRLVGTADFGIKNLDWQLGYGYFWRTQGGMYRGDGALFQFLVVSPRDDIVVVTTGEHDLMQQVLDLMHDHIFSDIGDVRKLKHDSVDQALRFDLELRDLAALSMLNFSELEDHRIFTLENNAMGIERMSFNFEDKGVIVRLEHQAWLRDDPLRLSEWIENATKLSAQPLHIASASEPECSVVAGAAGR